MINCIIVDDDPVSINLIRHFISNTEGLNLMETFTNPIEAINYCRKNGDAIDLIFLDVEMPEISGLDFLASFRQLPSVVLITSKEKYAVKAFDHNVVHFLVKPVEYGKFLSAVERVYLEQEPRGKGNPDFIFIKDDGLLVKVALKDIYYCEALGDYVKVITASKSYLAGSTMKNIEEKLKHDEQFVRIHRSYIINIIHLENFDTETSIVGGKIIPIGNKYRAELQRRLNII